MLKSNTGDNKSMLDGIDNMNIRMNFYGGKNQEKRMQNDKLRALKKALLYSYQSETIQIKDKTFRALINPDKNKPDYDDKILSIPYESYCLDTKQNESTNLQVGDVFKWVDTETYWIVYLQFLEENAYFRAEIRRCDQQIEINGNLYWVYIRGPLENTITWNQKNNISWNDLNYSLVMYVTNNEETRSYLSRFKTIKILDPVSGNKQTWQVTSTNPYYGDGIIQVYLDEYYENELQEEYEKNQLPQESIPEEGTYIAGPDKVKPYDEIVFSLVNYDGTGEWVVQINENQYTAKNPIKQKNSSAWVNIQKQDDVIVQEENNLSIKVILNIGKGSFLIIYNNEEGEQIASKKVIISDV